MRQDKNKHQKNTSSAWMLILVMYLSILMTLLFFIVPAKKAIPAQQIESEIKASTIVDQKPTA